MKHRQSQGAFATLTVFAWALFAHSALASDTLGVKPFSGNYSVVFRGINAGNIDFILRPATQKETQREAGNNCYVYESIAHARGLAKLVVRHTVREASTFCVENGIIKPIYYELDDGSANTKDDTRLTFDWNANKAQGVHEDRAIELPLTPGMQDRMSAQVITIKSLLAGSLTQAITFVDRDELKDYRYQQVRSEKLNTKLGELETVVIESSRPESNRLSRLWYAPSLGFIPVRGEQQRKGNIETVFEIQSLNQASPR